MAVPNLTHGSGLRPSQARRRLAQSERAAIREHDDGSFRPGIARTRKEQTYSPRLQPIKRQVEAVGTRKQVFRPRKDQSSEAQPSRSTVIQVTSISKALTKGFKDRIIN
jgi:hypothetical protein